MTTPDRRTEQWLESYGINTFALTTIPVERIDRPSSLANQARLGSPVNDEVADGYANAMTSGDVFPPIVVLDQGAKGYLVIDGNHRVEAKVRNNDPEIDAYIVRDITLPQRLMLTFDANTRHGYRTTTNERIQQALTLVANGVTVQSASSALNVPWKTIAGMVNSKDAERQLLEAGVDISKLHTGHFNRLSSIRSHPVRTAAAKWFADQKINTTDASNYVAQLNTLSSEGDQLDYIRRESGKRSAWTTATAKGRVTLPAPIAHLQRALADIDQINTNDITSTAVEQRLNNQLKTVLASKALDASVKLRRLAEKLGN